MFLFFFDYSHLRGDCVHAAFLWDVLAQQDVEVFVAAALPNAMRVSEVGLNSPALDPPSGGAQFFTVVYRQALASAPKDLRRC